MPGHRKRWDEGREERCYAGDVKFPAVTVKVARDRSARWRRCSSDLRKPVEDLLQLLSLSAIPGEVTRPKKSLCAIVGLRRLGYERCQVRPVTWSARRSRRGRR